MERDHGEAYRLEEASEARALAERVESSSTTEDCSDSDSWTLVSMSHEDTEISPSSSLSLSEPYAWASISAFFERIAGVKGAAADRIMGTGRDVMPRGLLGAA